VTDSLGWKDCVRSSRREKEDACRRWLLATLDTRGKSLDQLTRLARRAGYRRGLVESALRLLRKEGAVWGGAGAFGLFRVLSGTCGYCGAETFNNTFLLGPGGYDEGASGFHPTYEVDPREAFRLWSWPLPAGSGSLFVKLRDAGDPYDGYLTGHCGVTCWLLARWWERNRECEQERREAAQRDWEWEAKEHVRCLMSQIAAVKRWLKTRDPAAFQSLPRGYGPLRTSP
jgi:hypothetical protein